MSKPTISPSLIKDYWDYRNKEKCGLLFEATWIDRTIPLIPYEELPEPILIGFRFEYLVTGAIPRRRETPPPELLTPTGKRSSKNDHIEAQVSLCKKTLSRYKVEILDTNFKMEYDCGNYTMKSYQDIYCKIKGKPAFIDLKSTGLLDNKWEDTGWGLERLAQKTKLMIQPAFAKLSAQNVLHLEDIDYYFYVASSTNGEDARFIKVDMSQRRLAEFADLIEDVGVSVFVEQDLGFTPIPNYKSCIKCPLMEKCSYYVDTPSILKLNLDSDD